jgi:predicted amidohydrolase
MLHRSCFRYGMGVCFLLMRGFFSLGYAFESASAILPFLEHPQTGVTSQFCASIAQRLGCHVAAGYPERLEPDEVEKRTLEDGSVVDVVGANSAVVYGPDGTRVGHHRKSHLFYMDKPWAKPGKLRRDFDNQFCEFLIFRGLHLLSLDSMEALDSRHFISLRR